MSKEKIKNELLELTKELIGGIKLVGAVIEMEHPGCGHLAFDVMAEELDKLRNKNEPVQGDTCCNEGPGVAKEPEKPVLYFDFGSAIKAVKKGKSVARKGWNGKNQYVELATHISYKAAGGEIVNVHHNNIGNAALAFIGTSGVQMGWLASQADMLAEDWYIVE